MFKWYIMSQVKLRDTQAEDWYTFEVQAGTPLGVVTAAEAEIRKEYGDTPYVVIGLDFWRETDGDS